MEYEINDDESLLRSSDKGIQIVAQHSIKERILHINHRSLFACHLGDWELYHIICKYLYWPSFAVHCYARVHKCPHFPRNHIKLRKNVTRLPLFPSRSPLTSVCINILGEFIKTQRRKENLLFITDQFSKMTKTVAMKGISYAEVASHFINSWLFNYSPPRERIADNGRCFTSQFFIDV